MNQEDTGVLRKMIAAAAQQHADMARQRDKIQRIGSLVMGFSIGSLLSMFLLILFYHPVWFNWAASAAAALVLSLIIPIYRKNARWIRAHRAVAAAMVGMLNSQYGTNLRAHYMDQARAGLDDMIGLGGKALADRVKELTDGCTGL